MNFKDTKFYKMGSLFMINNKPLIDETICSFDATLYSTNKPLQYNQKRIKFHVHLCLYLSILEQEMPEMSKFIQNMWDANNSLLEKLGAKPYHQFLLINHGKGIDTHSHGNYMPGGTLTCLAVLGNTDTKNSFFVFDESNIKIRYPKPNSGFHFLAFEENLLHHTECLESDSNYYFHFINDLTNKIHIQTKVMIPINNFN